MSPEQATSDGEVDGRSDLYSLACVFYEMVAGEPPFRGSNARTIIARHLVDPVPSLRAARPSVTESLERTVQIALAKAPADRFESAAHFAAALSRKDAANATHTQKTILVLPFANVTGDPGHEFFSDGLTDELISDLSMIRSLRVISRTSAMRLKGTTRDLRVFATKKRRGNV